MSNMQMKSHACHTQLQAQNESAPTTPPHAVALLVGFARVARGEIGFLIASLSQSSRTLTLRLSNEFGNTSSNEDIFQVISWAVVLCTITGPLGVGVIARRLTQQTTQMNWLFEYQQLSRQQVTEHPCAQTYA